MTNHYHLLLQTPNGNLSQIMRHINGAYTTYYNVKRKHAGHLFQGRYKAIVVEADQYALELSRYIHLNPVRVGIVTNPENYRWSSYLCYIGDEQRPPWLNCNLILGLIATDVSNSQGRYREFVEKLQGEKYDSPLQRTVGSTILGGDDFVESVMAENLEKETESPDLPAVRALNRRFHIENIIAKTQELIKDPAVARKVAVYLCHRHSGETLKNIGGHFGLGGSGVGKASRRLEKKLEVEVQLHEIVKEIIHCLSHVKVKT